MTTTIRPATPRDAVHLAALVDMASGGIASQLWREMAAAGEAPFEVGRARALRDEGAFSWRNAHVAEIDGEVAAGLVGYPIDDPVDLSGMDDLSPFARALTQLEAEAPGHWYVNVLATYPEHRGKGLGGALLNHADDLGRRSAPNGMAIIVSSENAVARRLYTRAGYAYRSERPFVGPSGLAMSGTWLLLTKPHS